MGIREEIEKLREDIGVPLASTYNSALDDVLSILDKWELVEEIETKSDTGFLHITISDYELGDRIAIYRRKRE